MLRSYHNEWGEARLARRSVCPLWVFCVYKKVADSDDVVIQKLGLSTVGIRVPAIAMLLSPWFWLHMWPYSYRNQIFQVGHHQGVRRFVSPGLHHIMPVSCSHCGMSPNERHTMTSFGLFPPSLAVILCHQQTLRTAVDWDWYPRVAKTVLEYGGENLWRARLSVLAELRYLRLC